MKQRFFYLEDINTVETVETMTKKELISHAEGFKNYTFCEHDEVISGYTKDGKFFYYDCTNFWNFKKSDIVNAISVVYSSESGYYVYGDYTVNMYGIVNPTEDGKTLIWAGGNIKEVESADYTENQTTEDQAAEVQAAEVQAAEDQAAEDQTTEEIKKVSYDVFKTFQAGNKFDIYFHKPDRWKFDRPPVIAKETEYSVYYCHERDKNDVLKFLNRNAAR